MSRFDDIRSDDIPPLVTALKRKGMVEDVLDEVMGQTGRAVFAVNHIPKSYVDFSKQFYGINGFEGRMASFKAWARFSTQQDLERLTSYMMWSGRLHEESGYLWLALSSAMLMDLDSTHPQSLQVGLISAVLSQAPWASFQPIWHNPIYLRVIEGEGLEL